jgi:hypothetical protein
MRANRPNCFAYGRVQLQDGQVIGRKLTIRNPFRVG